MLGPDRAGSGARHANAVKAEHRQTRRDRHPFCAFLLTDTENPAPVHIGRDLFT
jgi:hypothetical protein